MTIIKGTHSKPGQVVAVTRPAVRQLAAAALSPAAAAAIVQDASGVDEPNHSFQYLTFKENELDAPPADALLPADDPATVINNLKALATQMVESKDATTPSSTIPAVYTYFGQFIDHDITAGTDRRADTGFNLLDADIFGDSFGPHTPTEIVKNIVNLRLPQLDLDSIYGGEQGAQSAGVPEEGIYEADGIRLRLGEIHVILNVGVTPQPELDDNKPSRRDLPRRKQGEDGVDANDVGAARIGDARNDENLIVAQLHTAFLRYHNHVVDLLDADPALLLDPLFQGLSKFRAARQIVRWTYQWLVVEDFLRTVTRYSVVNEVLAASTGFFSPRELFMPLEFSVASFRLGHSMVRGEYDFNENFTFGGGLVAKATFDQIFKFTHLGGGANEGLPNIWIIDWERFTDKHSPNRFARKIDTRLTDILMDLPNVNEDPVSISKKLAIRNLLRGYLFSIPTGQHVAAFFNVQPLTSAELTPADNQPLADAVTKGGFDLKTPLWYYILREAEVQEQGNRLGEVGSRIVAGTLIGLLKSDPTSYLIRGWTPSHATAPKLPGGVPIEDIADFLQLAQVMPLVSVAA